MRYVCLWALALPLLSTLDRPAASISVSDDRLPRRTEALSPADLFALIGSTAAANGADADAVAAFAETCKVDRASPDTSMGCGRWKFQTSIGPCRITVATLAGESEGWGIAGRLFCGSSQALAAYFISRNPLLVPGSQRPVGSSEIHG